MAVQLSCTAILKTELYKIISTIYALDAPSTDKISPVT